MSARLPIAPRRLAAFSSGRPPVYLDHACLTPAPIEVAQAVARFYRQPPGCPLRSGSSHSTALEHRIREARDRVRGWLNARFSDEIVFVPNTTLAINLIAGAFARRAGAVLITDAEHNSNRLPWLEQERVELAWPPGADFPLEDYRRRLAEGRIKLVSITAMSNVTGQPVPVREVVAEAHERDVPIHLDAAQLAIHRGIDVGEDGPDLLSLSLHKAYGPSGLGVLHVGRGLHDALRPTLAGGGTVDDHHGEAVEPASGAARFEFGLQNYAAQFAVPEAIAFLEEFDRPELDRHFATRVAQAREGLRSVPGIRFIGCGGTRGGSIVNFAIEGRDSMRVAELLDLAGRIQVRAGRMCAHHAYHRYALPPSVRVSFGYHTTEAEVDHFVRTLHTLVQRYL